MWCMYELWLRTTNYFVIIRSLRAVSNAVGGLAAPSFAQAPHHLNQQLRGHTYIPVYKTSLRYRSTAELAEICQFVYIKHYNLENYEYLYKIWNTQHTS